MRRLNDKIIIRILLKLVFLIIFTWLIFGILFGIRRTDSVSMSPSINAGDLLLFSRTNSEYEIDDAVIYIHDGTEYISRIAAKADEIITIDTEGYLVVNEQRISSTPIIDISADEKAKISLPYRVPSDSYFVINENPDNTDDSISFGSIKHSDIKGKVISILRTRKI